MTKTTYSITPHVGAKPLLLGMSPSDVESVLGQARMKSRTFQKELTYDYEFLNVGFDKADRVCHIGFVPGSCVEYDGPFDPQNRLRLGNPPFCPIPLLRPWK